MAYPPDELRDWKIKEGVDEEVAHIDTAADVHLQTKGSEFPIKTRSGNQMESAGIIPVEAEYHESSTPQALWAILDGKDVNMSSGCTEGLDRPYVSPHLMDATGMVEELTVRNYDNLNMTVVGPSRSDKTPPRLNQRHQIYPAAGRSALDSMHGGTANQEERLGRSNLWDDMVGASLSENLPQKPSKDKQIESPPQLPISVTKEITGKELAYGAFRTKILSKSGFSEFFLKSTLKGKGIICRGPPVDNQHIESRNQHNVKVGAELKIASDAKLSSAGNTLISAAREITRTRASHPDNTGFKIVSDAQPSSTVNALIPAVSEINWTRASRPDNAGLKIASIALLSSAGNTPISAASEITRTSPSCPDDVGINLRTWLDDGNREVYKVERLNIFRQIVGLLDYHHSHGFAVPELRPSSFKLLPLNQVKYIGPLQQGELLESRNDRHMSNSSASLVTKRTCQYGLSHPLNLSTKKQKLSEDNIHSQWPICNSGTRSNSMGDISACELQSNNDYGELNKENDSQKSSKCYKTSFLEQHSTITSQLEDKWYQSPEEHTNCGSSISSNIYCLGVLLFELLGHFDCQSARDAAMMDLHHRILLPSFLSENPKEAGFCLLLLYPDPASRPSSRKILESEVLAGLMDKNSEEWTSCIEQDDAESEILLHFLASLKEQKQKEVSKLVENISCLETDIAEIGRRHSASAAKPSAYPYLAKGSSYKNCTSSDEKPWPSPVCNVESRWLGNIKLLEAGYFSMRSRIQLPEIDISRRTDNDLLRNRETLFQTQQRDEEQQITSDRVGAFFDGLCKYARHSKFEVRGILRNGEFNNSTNVICSLSFSRDEDYFAAAGVSKKIKVFEFQGLLNESVDIHYPAVEMTNRSKLSCICWNKYIRNHLASTDYDGIVKLWDASTGQCFSEYREHEKRAWSVDFSPVCPTKFASGSDDCSVKLWSISERNCLGTIRNIANVCCVQFSAHSSHLLAFGSADYKTYCYDLRNVRSPWCVLSGHRKAVSFVKFIDAGTIVTTSTDNSLKLWDLNKTIPGGLSMSACSLTLTGHTNEKNFVGLSAADGYISCGSETNEVFAYYRSLPMPITSHKFGSIDPISGKETDDDNGQFVSSVCWKGKSDMLIAASSSGCIKALQMV